MAGSTLDVGEHYRMKPLRGGRTRDSSWQWLIIGLVLGMGCASVFCLAGYATRYIVFNLPGQPVAQVDGGPTAFVIITATPPPATATTAATIAATQAVEPPTEAVLATPTFYLVNPTKTLAP